MNQQTFKQHRRQNNVTIIPETCTVNYTAIIENCGSLATDFKYIQNWALVFIELSLCYRPNHQLVQINIAPLDLALYFHFAKGFLSCSVG